MAALHRRAGDGFSASALRFRPDPCLPDADLWAQAIHDVCARGHALSLSVGEHSEPVLDRRPRPSGPRTLSVISQGGSLRMRAWSGRHDLRAGRLVAYDENCDAVHYGFIQYRERLELVGVYPRAVPRASAAGKAQARRLFASSADRSEDARDFAAAGARTSRLESLSRLRAEFDHLQENQKP